MGILMFTAQFFPLFCVLENSRGKVFGIENCTTQLIKTKINT